MSDTVEMVFNFVIGLIFWPFMYCLTNEVLRRQMGRLARAYGKDHHIKNHGSRMAHGQSGVQ